MKAIKYVALVGAHYIHGMQWMTDKHSGAAYSGDTLHECGGIQVLRHKLVETAGSRSTSAVRLTCHS